MYFTDLPLDDDLLDALYDMRFDECTPVQEKCIPPILDGNDVIGIAQTGTGKTAAYLLPLLTLLKQQPHPQDAVNCLIMAPTRELARQIDQALQGFGYYMDINGVAVYGGNDGERYEQERRSLKSGADIVIATPGRLITHMKLGGLDLSRTTHFVLDEADRMLDMGFYDDIMKIARELPEQRQTILFSATMPQKIGELAKNLLHNPVEVKLAISKPAEKIKQSVYLCHEPQKARILQSLFKQEKPQRVIVFASSKIKVKDLAIALKRNHWNVEAMHSDLEQKQRDEVMLAFKAGRVDVLVATDIVARGIDIDDITMVVNYDVPRDAEDYVHRIGRTARAGREGRAVTFVNEKDRPALRSIEQLLEKKIPREELPDGMTAAPEEEKGTPQKKDRRRGNGKRRRSNGNRRSSADKDVKATSDTSGTQSTDTASTDTNTKSRQDRQGHRHRRRNRSNRKKDMAPKDTATHNHENQ